MPTELLTFLGAMLPLTELRAALPLGIASGLPIYSAIFFATLGNCLISVILVYTLPHLERIARKSSHLDRLATKVFAKTRAKHGGKLERWGELFLVVLVAIPLPGSGGWTGSLVAYLFGFEKKKASLLICLGVLISGLIVGTLSAGVIAALPS